jgi:UDP-glucose 4-epimerase
MNILIVGGAGYIGSVVTRLLFEKGFNVSVMDNLSLGHRAAVDKNILFLEGDMAQKEHLKAIFSSHSFDAVMHFAAYALVGESVEVPLMYYHNNVGNTINLLRAMKEVDIPYFIFSSTAAVFGNPKKIPINENHPQNPINPYGWSKSMVEQILMDASAADDFKYISLRYFNAAGAYPDGSIGEDHQNETHLIPLVLKAVQRQEYGDKPLKIFGTDYDTPDGTCIRDYIHVLDLAEAHIRALEHLASGGESDVFNLGNGKGFSVLEVIQTAERVTGRKVPTQNVGRRAGDPSILVASSEKISKALGWRSSYAKLETIIETAWKWHSTHPEGYPIA